MTRRRAHLRLQLALRDRKETVQPERRCSQQPAQADRLAVVRERSLAAAGPRAMPPPVWAVGMSEQPDGTASR